MAGDAEGLMSHTHVRGEVVIVDGLPVALNSGWWILPDGEVWALDAPKAQWVFLPHDGEPERIESIGQYFIDRFGELPKLELGPGVQDLLDMSSRGELPAD